MNFGIDEATLEMLEEAREWGRNAMRPAGIEADQQGRPIPVDHPYFEKYVADGRGGTRWPGPDGSKRKESRAARPLIAGLLLSEEAAYWDRGVAVANPGPGLPENNVLAMGTPEQKEKYLGPFVEPDRPRWACFGMTEPSAGSDAAAIKTLARKDGKHWVLNGAKCFIGGASRSDWILVQATIDPE
jgi:acyl-CoA dehydrogenase